jgi:hypothetical protein
MNIHFKKSIFLSAICLITLPSFSDTPSGPALWSNLAQTMLGNSNHQTSFSFKELPSWMPFESFNFFNTIFINSDIRNLPINEQRAIIGHELSHVVAGHSSKQIAAFLTGSLIFAYFMKKCLRSSPLTSLSTYSKTIIGCISAYAWYYFFNAHIVYHHELEAERFNALCLKNYDAVIKRLCKLITREEQNYSSSSWSDMIFKCIAPRFPSAAKFLNHIMEREH